MNIDYAICQALSYNTHGLSQALITYDVACQWSVNFDERVKQNVHLHLPKDLKYTAAVGKFHLAAHREDCFAQYSLNFVQGAGQQDGEVLETLWSSLNKVAGSIRAMTMPHRQERLDQQILDSNWKKHVNMGMLLHLSLVNLMFIFCCVVNSLKRNYLKALPAKRESLDIFKELDQSVDPELRKDWEEQERLAMTLRGDHLDVYNVNKEKGKARTSIRHNNHLYCIAVPGNYSVPSAPGSNSSTNSNDSTTLWLQTGIGLEVEQYVFQVISFSSLTTFRSQLCHLVRRLKRNPNPQLAKKLAGRRLRFQTKIDAFLDKMPISIGSLFPKDQSAIPQSNQELDIDDDTFGDEDDTDEDGYDDETDELEDDDPMDIEDSIKSPVTNDQPENIKLPLPSHLGLQKHQDQSITALVEDEIALRQSQASQALEQVRLSLGLKSAIFRKKGALPNSQYNKTRAWKAVNAVTGAVQQHARLYGLAQHALVQLKADDVILKRFPVLQKGDLAVSRDVVEENRLGQRSEHVGWIWRLDIGSCLDEDEWMQESESHSSL